MVLCLEKKKYFMYFDNIGMKTEMNMNSRNSGYFKHVTKRNVIKLL